MSKEPKKTFKDAVGAGEIEFYKDLPRVDKNSIIDIQVKVLHAQIVKDWESDYGSSDFCLLHIGYMDSENEATTLVGGVAIVKTVKKALESKALPLLGTLRLVQGQNFPYYVIE